MSGGKPALPHWAEAAKKALQPSSAASERVFSLLNNTFGKRQNSSLEDYVEMYNVAVYHFYVGIFGAKIMAMPKGKFLAESTQA